ncbi:Rne/Rng family ribonuclease [bacterium]|nr:Rne/Rng family ribonuclease [bacterium]
MRKQIIVNEGFAETRIALLEDNDLVELIVEKEGDEKIVGSIYKGTVTKVLKPLKGIFINIGLEQDAFLHFSDVADQTNKIAYGTNDISGFTNSKPVEIRGNLTIAPGQKIIVQAQKEPIGKKGVKVTSEISLPGRFLVLLPEGNNLNVSKKIESNKEKKRLKEIVESLLPVNFGVIVRTEAEEEGEESLKNDLQELLNLWKQIQKKVDNENIPLLLHQDASISSSVIRDLFREDIDRVVVDAKKVYKEISNYIKDVAPNLVDKIEIYQAKKPIFDEFGIEKQILESQSKNVPCGNGAYVVIEPTEALVSIDVNSGKYLGNQNSDLNSLKVNLSAARQIAKQLRLRDIGGLIIIDFIDMLDRKNKETLFQTFKQELSKDRAKWSMTPISKFGLIELTRQRERESLFHTLSEVCPTCDGKGRIFTKETIIDQISRWLARFKLNSSEIQIKLVVNESIKTHLTEGLKSIRLQLMFKYFLKIDIEADNSLFDSQFKFFSKKTGEEITKKFETAINENFSSTD